MPSKFLTVPAILAVASLAATPAAAAELAVARSAPIAAPVEGASNYGPWVNVGYGGGWGGGWGGGYRGGGHHGGGGAGSVLAGVLILGTIAAVASAASKARARRPYPDRYPYPNPNSYPYPNPNSYPDQSNPYRPPNPDRQDGWRSGGPMGLEGAANLCLSQVERNARAREVTRVERNAGGWLVTGAMADGAAFSCSIGADGRIERVDVGGRAQELGAADRQYGDDTYRAARGEAPAGPQPAYPGGPLPGEETAAPPPQS